MLRKFNDHFKKDENGKRREWRDIEEAKIREYFEESKRKVDTVFEQFKRIFFPTGITKVIQTPGGGMNDMNKSTGSMSMEELIRNAAAEDGGPTNEADFDANPGFRR